MGASYFRGQPWTFFPTGTILLGHTKTKKNMSLFLYPLEIFVLKMDFYFTAFDCPHFKLPKHDHFKNNPPLKYPNTFFFTLRIRSNNPLQATYRTLHHMAHLTADQTNQCLRYLLWSYSSLWFNDEQQPDMNYGGGESSTKHWLSTDFTHTYLYIFPSLSVSKWKCIVTFYNWLS